MQITYSSSFALYHLATNKEKQRKLYEESLTLLPNETMRVTSEVLARAEYLKACLKESLRLNPVSVGVGRILEEDAVFSGYFVPAGVCLYTFLCDFQAFFFFYQPCCLHFRRLQLSLKIRLSAN